jgi:periplasmic divalent cation tolerance protein
MNQNDFEFRLIYITCKNKEEAVRIGRTLVQEQLVACANIIDPIQSIYKWNDEIVEDTEAILILKTIGLNMISIESRVKSIHSYTNPCIVSFKIEDGSKIYFDWIRSSIVQQSY